MLECQYLDINISASVEVLRRYLNHSDKIGPVVAVLDRIAANDQTNEPGVVCAGGPSPSPKRLTREQVAGIVELFRQGTLIREIAEQYNVTEGCVKRKLHQRGVGRQDRY